MDWIPRNGQWVIADIPDYIRGAHRAKDGSAVGIFVHGPPALIAICAPNGDQLMMDVDGHSVAVKLAPSVCKNIRPATSRDDIPYERIKHLPPDWQPQP